jgi:CubicO group peptidase (beta-lactamase class C family)
MNGPKPFQRLVGLLLVALLVAGCGGAPPPSSRSTAGATATASSPPATPPVSSATALPASERAQFTTVLEKLSADDAFSGVVLVAKDGAPVVKEAYGMADKEANRPNQVDTKFLLASITKSFTAVAIAQLAEQGKLAVTDPIRTHLPDYPNPEVADTVTIHHLLTHTSGLGDHVNEKYHASKDTLRRVADYLPLFADDPLAFPPGERWEYSNAGYIVLGAIIEHVAGQNYYDYVDEHIFAPAGMTNSGFYERDQDVANFAMGYTGTTYSRSKHTVWLPFKGSAEGGAYSTVEDLLMFERALLSHQLLRAETTELVLSGKTDIPDSPGLKYAYGFFEFRQNGIRIVQHSGGLPGVNTEFVMDFTNGYTVIVLSNYNYPAAEYVVERFGETFVR